MTAPAEVHLSPAGVGPAMVSAAACCAVLYGNPLIELLVGESLHPGGSGLTRKLLASARLRPNARLLDVGCGPGVAARLAASEFSLRVDGIDVSGEAIARARRRATAEGVRVRFREGSLLELPFPDATFDAVLAECVLSVADRERGLAEIRRVLVTGGSLLMSDVSSAQPTTWLHEPFASLLCLSQPWTPATVVSLLASQGFKLDRQWNEDAALADFARRAANRYSLLRAMTRDGVLRGAVEELIDALNGGAPHSGAEIERALLDVRGRIAAAELGYLATIATAV